MLNNYSLVLSSPTQVIKVILGFLGIKLNVNFSLKELTYLNRIFILDTYYHSLVHLSTVNLTMNIGQTDFSLRGGAQPDRF